MKLTINEIQKIESDILKEVSIICNDNNIDYYLAYGSVIGAVRHNGAIPWDTDADIVVPIDQMEKFITVARKYLSEKYYLDYYDVNPYYPTFFPRIALKGYSSKILHLDVFKLVGLPNDSNKQKKMVRRFRLLSWLFEVKKMHKNYYGSFVTYKQLILNIKNILLFFVSSKFLINKFEKYCSKYSYNDSEFVINSVPGYAKREILPKRIYGKGRIVKYSDFHILAPEETEAYLRHFYGDYMKIPPENERKVETLYEIDEIKL